MTCLYVAPHLDDVALSCAGGLLARRARGEQVAVCTVFSGTGRSVRRREDVTALASIGASCIHLDFEDAPQRLGIRPSFSGLILDAEVRPTLATQVERAIRRVIRELRPAEVWLPLGVGGHINHLTVFAARGAAGELARYYEERPYSFVPAFRGLRRLQLLGGHLRRPAGPTTIARQVARGGCGAMLPHAVRLACTTEISERLGRRYPGEVKGLRSRLVRFDRDGLSGAAAFIQGYRTEIEWLFGETPVRELWRTLATTPSKDWYEREIRVVER